MFLFSAVDVLCDFSLKRKKVADKDNLMERGKNGVVIKFKDLN